MRTDETERLPDVPHITVASFAAVEQMMCLVFRVQCEFDAAMVWKCLLDCRVNIIIFLHFERYDWLFHNLSLCLHLRNLKGHSCLPFRSWLYYDLRQSCIPKILVNEMCEMQTNMFTGCCPSHACLNLLILWNTQLHACIRAHTNTHILTTMFCKNTSTCTHTHTSNPHTNLLVPLPAVAPHFISPSVTMM